MGLFVRKTNSGSHLVPPYSISAQSTTLIVGLGNPGKEYDTTRHNTGFAAVEAFAELNSFPNWTVKKDVKSQLTSHTLGEMRVILAKPTTFMNLSGQAVRAIMQFYKVPIERVLVVHDELDLPFGIIRTQVGGGTAGHNGLKSIVEHCGDNFGRIRVGIKNELRDKMDGADFVLAKFLPEEQAHTKALAQEVTAILTETIYGDGLVPETRNFIIET